MTLNQAIAEYKTLKVSEGFSSLAFGNRTQIEQETVKFFNKVDKDLSNILKESTDDSFTACLLFSEMAMRKLGGDFSALLAYYYGTKAISQPNIPENSHIAARRLRLFALFRNLDKFDRLISMAQAPIGDYQGSLNNEEFIDFLIMSDAYLVWDSDESSNLLKSIQKLTKQHEPNHPNYTKSSIIREGAKAHAALFNIVSIICSSK